MPEKRRFLFKEDKKHLFSKRCTSNETKEKNRVKKTMLSRIRCYYQKVLAAFCIIHFLGNNFPRFPERRGEGKKLCWQGIFSNLSFGQKLVGEKF